MRWIAPNETCLSASEIAAKFTELSGVELHPTNVGNAAKTLGLDYIEVADPDGMNPAWGATQKRYAEADMPDIFRLLHELSERRAFFRSKP